MSLRLLLEQIIDNESQALDRRNDKVMREYHASLKANDEQRAKIERGEAEPTELTAPERPVIVTVVDRDLIVDKILKQIQDLFNWENPPKEPPYVTGIRVETYQTPDERANGLAAAPESQPATRATGVGKTEPEEDKGKKTTGKK